jgi:oligopeptide/dipeptide ABC transporter ATP-binding protein
MSGLMIEDLRTTFGSGESAVPAVQGVTFRVPPGGTFVLLGESGSGKSVTARSVLRLYRQGTAISGRARLGDDDLMQLGTAQLRAIRGRRIALVPQDPTAALDPLRSIGSQIVEALRSAAKAGGESAPTKAAARVRSRELLRLVGIADPARIARARPHELSGGMRQRAVIAIAVCAEPEVLIADEPTTALDVTVQAQVLDLFLDLQQRLGTALLLVTHDVGVADEIGGDVGVMYAGRLVETGPTRAVLDDPVHPYTKGLLDSLPSPEVPRGQLRAIAGRPPLTGEQFPGCPFAPRCPAAEDACTGERPPLLQVPGAGGRMAACPVVIGSSADALAVAS